jgi:hypothetical protein
MTATETINAIEATLKPAIPSVIDEFGWHCAAPDFIMGSHAPFDTADQLLETGLDILNGFPIEVLMQHVSRAPSGQPALEAVRQSRKLLMIGRDVVMLTSSNKPFKVDDPVFNLCRTLGQLADTVGHDPRILQRTWSDIDAFLYNTPLDAEPAAMVTVRNRALTHLSTASLLLREPTADPDKFHQKRIAFRRVAHLAVATAANRESSASNEAFIGTAMELNRRYGHFHDSLHRDIVIDLRDPIVSHSESENVAS